MNYNQLLPYGEAWRRLGGRSCIQGTCWVVWVHIDSFIHLFVVLFPHSVIRSLTHWLMTDSQLWPCREAWRMFGSRSYVRGACWAVCVHGGERVQRGSVGLYYGLHDSWLGLQCTRLQQHGCLSVSSCRRLSQSRRRQVLRVTCHSPHCLQGVLCRASTKLLNWTELNCNMSILFSSVQLRCTDCTKWTNGQFSSVYISSGHFSSFHFSSFHFSSFHFISVHFAKCTMRV